MKTKIQENSSDQFIPLDLRRSVGHGTMYLLKVEWVVYS